MSEHEGREIKIKIATDSKKALSDKGTPRPKEEASGMMAVGNDEKPRESARLAAEETPDSLGKIRKEVSERRETLEIADRLLEIIDKALKEPADKQSRLVVLLRRLLEAEQESAENRDRWIRTVADLDNFKKRSVQEKSRILKYGNEQLLRDLLPVLDNLERALEHSEHAPASDSLVQGVTLIAGLFKGVLEKYGVTEIEALGHTFDPNLHEAMLRLSVPGQKSNQVVQELEKGYMYHDRLLRPAKVAVSANEDQSGL